ncbi:MAG: double-strand break repair protein AddB [Acidocella sp.]|nr:double-strand break repair protein AddB [Acidocella sp.]
MRLASFPADAAFLPALAHAWLTSGSAAFNDASDGLIILPNRRAARALAGAFLQANNGKPLLLPRIIAWAAIDEAALALAGVLRAPPAVPSMLRQTFLTKLILARRGQNGAPTRLHNAWSLAGDLAALLDEAITAEIDLREALPGVVSAELALHWQTTLEFLQIITQAWPAILSEMSMIDPALQQVLLVRSQAQAWDEQPPQHKIWLVARDATPALGRLAKTIAQLPQGVVILPGYDATMPAAVWEAVDESHAQAGIAKLLAYLGVRHEEIETWPALTAKVPAGRQALVSTALLPGAHLSQWQTAATLNPSGLFRLASRDEHEEAIAIAMVLRDALELPGRTAALITPDRGQAVRVAAALRRFGIVADDSAGEPLGDTPPAVFLRLLAQAAMSDYAPLHLLALLKHPLAAAGEPPEVCRDHARTLELAALRGARPAPGFDEIKFRLKAKASTAVQDFLDRLELCLRPVSSLPATTNAAHALRCLIEAGENLAKTEAQTGAARLWHGEAGLALSDLLVEALATLESLPDMPKDDLGDLLDVLFAGQAVRKPRTKGGHPRVAIWGVQEADLQTVDVAVLGGLVEGIWPALTDPGPWLSRPMRKAAGLPAAEQRTGFAAHDFFSLCCRCPVVVLAAPLRRERAPAVPARWITRLEALLAGNGMTLAPHPAQSWAAQIDLPAQRLLRAKPMPKPPANVRPRSLSISDVATLMADPYAIYVKKILGIRALDELDKESDASLFGDIVHDGLAEFFKQSPNFEAGGCAAQLTLSLHTAMRKHRPRAALQHWWEARLERIAAWIIAAERERRQLKGNPVKITVEKPAAMSVAELFTLTGRVDRIEQRQDGSIFIMDYKTGTPPNSNKVASGIAPQLPLEAVMAEAGAFGEDFEASVTELAFWKLSGRHVAGDDSPLFKKPEILRSVIDKAAQILPELFIKFANPATAYLSAPHPDRTTYDDPFRGLSRRSEWGGEGDGGEGGDDDSD